MKKITALFVAVLCSSFFSLQAQKNDSLNFPLEENTGEIKFQEVVEAEGSTKQLFYRAVTWMNEHWDNARGMIKKQDQNNGILEAHVRFDIKKKTEDGKSQRAGRGVYVLKMEFKEGRYRYTLTDFNLLKTSIYPLERWLDPENRYYDQRDTEILEFIANRVDEVIKSMKEGMEKEEKETDDDW
jgi:hypothetical protein